VRKAWIAVGLVLVIVLLLFFQAFRLRERYGEWGLMVPETPLRISTLGREYDRSTLPVTTSLPSDLRPNGETDGGGDIFVPTGLGHRVPVIVYVQDHDGGVWTYGLVGGP
jgi:hypothetical protein